MAAGYLIRRLLYGALTLFGVTVAVFVLIHAVPGDPVEFFIAGSGVRNAPPEVVEAVRAERHLDEPILSQYVYWLEELVTLDLGRSFSDGRPVTEKIVEKLPNTLALNFLALLVAAVVAIPLGVLAATRPRGKLDRTTGVVAFFLYSLPNFWVAVLLMELFAVRLQILPLYGMQSMWHESLGFGDRLVDHLRHLVLPVTSLAYVHFAVINRFVRSSVMDETRKEFITAARARGVGENALVWRHALANARIPLVTLIGLVIPVLLSGSVIVERIFQWDGVGRLYFDAILSRDYPVIMGLTLVAAVITLFASLLTDVLYALSDPRIGFESEGRAEH